jgi:hypothetical protein
MPPAAKSVEELFPLIESCKNGNLKAVSEWIATGNPLDLPGKKTRRASPLQIAIERDLLALVRKVDEVADRTAEINVISRLRLNASGAYCPQGRTRTRFGSDSGEAARLVSWSAG